MRIARIGNLYQPVPAVEYGGTQRSMAQMTALQAAVCAHDIILYASADSSIISFVRDVAHNLGLASKIDPTRLSISITNADGRIGCVQLKNTGCSSIGYKDDPEEGPKHDRLFAELLRDERAQPFDIIHCHVRRFMANHIIPEGLAYKTLVHQHNAVLEPNFVQQQHPIICISNSQADLMRRKYQANVFAVIHHGLDSYTHHLTTEHAGYLAWIGRFITKKGAHRAIQIAESANKPLVMAGTIFEKDAGSESHFLNDILPYTVHDATFLNRAAQMTPDEVRREIAVTTKRTGKNVIFCGPASEQQKQTLYGGALATLFPISWPEPFGRVMIESMACGTPVIGYATLGEIDCGAVAEVIENGVTGFALKTDNEQDALQQAIKAVRAAESIDRTMVRATFDAKWTSERVAHEINEVYKLLLAGEKIASRPAPSAAFKL